MWRCAILYGSNSNGIGFVKINAHAMINSPYHDITSYHASVCVRMRVCMYVCGVQRGQTTCAIRLDVPWIKKGTPAFKKLDCKQLYERHVIVRQRRLRPIINLGHTTT